MYRGREFCRELSEVTAGVSEHVPKGEFPNNYHDDFFIPGISPLLTIPLKQILHKPNFLIYPLFLPHLKQRGVVRVENFGTFFDFAI